MPQIKETDKEKEKEREREKQKEIYEFWKIWNSKCKKSCCFEGLGSLF